MSFKAFKSSVQILSDSELIIEMSGFGLSDLHIGEKLGGAYYSTHEVRSLTNQDTSLIRTPR